MNNATDRHFSAGCEARALRSTGWPRQFATVMNNHSQTGVAVVLKRVIISSSIRNF
jgi:hypothetical protein